MKPFLLIIFLLAAAAASAQQFSNRGREFWTGYGLHYFMEPGQNNSQEMVLYFSAEAAANVTVTTRGATANTVKQYAVPANSVIASDPMPKSGAEDCRLFDYPISYGGQGSDRLFDRSIHIESDVPIVAYAHISGAGSSGATMLMPVESWGYDYRSVNSQQVIRGVTTGEGCFSWLFIVAHQDNTVVEITPSVPLRNGAAAGLPFTATLQRGQVYQVVGAAISNIAGHDLTGTKVKSISNVAGDCYPVAVFAGSSSTAITCNGTNSGFADNLIQQIFPVQAWGKTYLTAPFSASDNAGVLNTGIFRIAVKDPATVVKRNGAVLTGLINNFYYEYQSATADYIEADKPILVTQYMPSMNDNISDGGCGFTGLGDPEMIYLSPVEQSIKRVGFYRNTAAVVEVNYLTLIIPTNGLGSLTIDGNNAFSHTYPHPNRPGYTVVVQRWPAAKAQCIVQSDSAFTAVTYGMGKYDSYGYNAGTMINNLNGLLHLHNTEGETGAVHPFTCRNTPVEISVLMAYPPNRLVWHLSQLQYASPNTDITQNNPVPVDTVLLDGRTYFKYTAPGIYTFSEAGSFRFEISSTHPSIENCNNTERLPLDIEVRDISNAAVIAYTPTGCLPDLVKFRWDGTNAGDYTFNRWLWTFPDNTTANTDTTSKLFTTPGNKPVRLQVISEEGCIDDTTVTVPVVAAQPEARFEITPAIICQGSEVQFRDQSISPGGPVTVWNWDFGDGTTATEQHPVKRYDHPGNYTARLSVATVAGCSSAPLEQELTVYVQPVVDAGPTVSVEQGTAVTLGATVNDPSLLLQWAPAAELSDPAALRPVYIAQHDQVFTLTATDREGHCSATDQAEVKILVPVKVPNAFSPNGDGINDTWSITNLAAYQRSLVEVFNRYGKRVFYSRGYATPWDGGGLPVGVYYYVIDLGNGSEKIAGYVTILK
ncbi:PKD domain-containing protein [Chitinophaga japonensis]|uniref:Gliding motility-associated-like protein n=1 Tax=Chitinophaga japonensis TaxID=104662 RepID=A0A562TC63_CHIJA|nr:PKD domain-containing protein [Chitinophaga japonensis]TWI90973.1 gliding motility-associated-like protein [Chitinophaga japonensis]